MPRVLLIGLDSADADLLDRWTGEGHLPVLAGLREQGVWGRLGTTANVMHVSAWPTLYTGALPGHHGMYHAYQVRAGIHGVRRTLPEWCSLPPFWKYVDDAGRRCLVMDAFMDYPLEGFGGIQILEYGTWTWFSEPSSKPGRCRKELVRRFGPYPAPEHTEIVGVPEPIRFRDRLVEGARVKGEASAWLLREHTWDMAFVTFGETHGAGHYLWHVSDSAYPSHPPGGVPGGEHALRDVYVAVDRAIGKVLEVVDDSTTVMLVSGDGMGPNHSAAHLMPDVLARLGFLSAAGRIDSESADRGGKRAGPLLRLRNAIPRGFRQSIARCLPRSLNYRLSMRWVNAAIDWERTRVFCIYNSNEGYFRINLEGREPAGIVEPGSESRHILDEVAAEVGRLRNPANSHAAAHALHRIDDVFPGPERHHLPDLVATWDPEARVLDELRSDSSGLIRGKAGYETPPYYSGNHRPNAFVLARGPRTSAGTLLEGGHILDLAPTVLTVLGIDCPPHYQGRAWREISGERPV